MQVFDTLFLNGTLVNHDGIGKRDVGVTNGRIVAIGRLSKFQAGEVIDCTGLHILPGVIDSQVHFREPGPTHKEDLESGSRAAVMGGVTTVFEMPNTEPQTTTAEALADKVKRAKNRMFCDFAFWVGGTHDNVKHIPELERLEAAAGIKVFMGSSTGSLLVEDDAGVRAILAATSRRAAFHSEDEYRLRERKVEQIADDPRSHPVWRDAEAAMMCTKRLVTISKETNAKIHVLHISTKEEIAYLANHKDLVTCEITPHHLTLHAPDCYERLGTLTQMNPPVRDISHQKALWWGIQQGVADVLGSDHAPHTLEEKAKAYPASPSGMTGVQTLLPLMLDHVSRGRLSLIRLIDLTAHGANRIYGMQNKGRIALGYDADFAIVDLKKPFIIKNEWIESKSQWTPYDGKHVSASIHGTIVRGVKAMWEGELASHAIGQPAQFKG